MDYTVGSLSDLITGTKTPNKRKIVKKEFIRRVKEEKSIDNDAPQDNEDNWKVKQGGELLKVPKKRRASVSVGNVEDEKSPKESKTNRNAERRIRKRNSLKKVKSKQRRNAVPTPKEENSIDNDAPQDNDDDSEVEQEDEPLKVPKKRRASVLVGNVEDEQSPKESKTNHNAERRDKKLNSFKKVKSEQRRSAMDLARTVFVGNLPITTTKQKLAKIFSKYGTVKSVRIRGIATANPKTPKKVAVIKKEFHPDRTSCNGYVKYEQPEDAQKSLKANGLVFKGYHLRLHLCASQDKPDENKAIFVGNLFYNAEDEDLWKLFEVCGQIDSVRIVRDSRTGVGKGFGYVNFHSSDAVQLALEMENVKLNDRQLRISHCNNSTAKKNKNMYQFRKINKPGKAKSPKKHQTTPASNVKQEVNGGQNTNTDVKVNANYQGSTFPEKKKKNKRNKGFMQKKKMIKLLAPKTEII